MSNSTTVPYEIQLRFQRDYQAVYIKILRLATQDLKQNTQELLCELRHHKIIERDVCRLLRAPG
jgi:hypothetical protein